MNTLYHSLTSIGLILFGVVISSLIDLPKLIDRKPFNCVVCLCFWLGIGYGLLHFDWLETIALGGAYSYSGWIIRKTLFK